MVSHQGRLLSDQNGVALFQKPPLIEDECEARYPVVDGVELLVLASTPDGHEPLDLRASLSQSDADQFEVLARAAQISVWHDQHRFCGRCGTPAKPDKFELAKVCSQCGLSVYPRISPCIIVLVVDGDRCLLGHNPRFPPGRFSTLAGFIEAGETAEAAVAREVREEVGVEVSNVRYVKSQSWPFPHSLMFGFIADYAGGALQPDGVEITEAGWFTRESLPDLPPRFSISYQLIERFLHGRH
ncbi:MAG: NAD(+) diphosphatase [Oceanospirillales bacterium]|nr:NAD(+) diphosphatase [Oceanospirillales bacterium]